MISTRALFAVYRTMKLGSLFKVFPYKWDPVRHRLETQTSKLGLLWYKIQEATITFLLGFQTFRFIQTLHDDDIPSRIRIMHFIWIISYISTVGCDIQYDLRREEIRFFANLLLQHLERNAEKQGFGTQKGMSEENEPKGVDWISFCVVVTSTLLILNAPAHAFALVTTPCAPFYLSSIIFKCASSTEIPMSLLERVPNTLFETFVVGNIVFAWTFNWTMVFVGLTWISDSTKKVISLHQNEVADVLDAPRKFRYVQTITLLLHDGFWFYLQIFPNALFFVAGLLIFGTIRYTHLEFHAYMLFPACGARCLFEGLTALAAAGKVNEEGITCATEWGRQVRTSKFSNIQIKFMRAFMKSCKELCCSSGSLYTFQNSIVLISLDNCVNLVVNMLVTYE